MLGTQIYSMRGRNIYIFFGLERLQRNRVISETLFLSEWCYSLANTKELEKQGFRMKNIVSFIPWGFLG